MSVQAMTYVFDEVRGVSPIQRLVLLSIANHADKYGENAWPSIATIAEEADVQRIPTVKQALRDLREAGLIEVEVNRGGDHRVRADRRPNLYRLPQMRGGTVGVLPTGDGGTLDGARGDAERADGGTVGVPQTILNHPDQTRLAADEVEPTPRTPEFIAEARARLRGGKKAS